MTDIPERLYSVPSRLGVHAEFDDGTLRLGLTPRPEVLNHGVIRASALSFVIDALAGILVDQDPTHWTFTSEMSVRIRPVPAPARVLATNTILRQGRRSATCSVDVVADGETVAWGALGFAKVLRRESDPPKQTLTPELTSRAFDPTIRLSRPLRDEAGIEVLDSANGVVSVEVTHDLRNTAGTIQGAMVALVAEAATEELLQHRFGAPVVVTDLDLRYLGQVQVGPIRTRSRLLGDGADAAVEVELIDTSTDRVTTHVYARAVRVGSVADGAAATGDAR